MLKYTLKRFVYMMVTIWIIITITFLMMHAIPGDPLATQGRKLPPQQRKNLEAKYGLDKPLYTQYYMFMKGLVTRFDLGESYTYPGMTVNSLIKDKAPVSGIIGGAGLFFGVVIGIMLGIIAAFKKGTTADYVVMIIAIIGIALPSFVLAALLQYVFTVKFRIFPTTGWGSFKNVVLPALSLGFVDVAIFARFMRSSCIEVINQDYILTANAKGISKLSVVLKHILRNAMMPIVTMLGPSIAFIFTGTFVIESIFSIPGIGRYFVSSISSRDFPVVLGTTIFVAILFIVSVFVVDITYGLIDPRVKIADKS
jgi:oligopeptide transport system permease protein